jgi:hypothetical protein
MQVSQTPDWIAIAKALQTPATPMWVKVLDAAGKVVQISAIVIGGVWAYYKFVKGRLYRPRLECSVTGEILRSSNRDYAVIAMSLKNCGTSKVEIRQEGTALRVFGCTNNDVADEGGDQVDWTHITTLSIFKQHAWIESSETIGDKVLVSLPADRLAVRLDFRIVGQRLEWSAKAIVKVNPDEDPSTDKSHHVITRESEIKDERL